jgi:hypothetical protein
MSSRLTDAVKLKSHLALVLRCITRGAILGALVAAVTAGAWNAAHASVIFTNLGAGNSYAGGIGWTVTGPNSYDGQADQSMPFTAAITADVSQIDIPLNFLFEGGSPSDPGPEHTGTVSLWTDTGGSLGTNLGSWSVTVPNSGLITISNIGGIDLTMGASYFLTASASGDDWDFWVQNSTGQQGTFIDAGSPQFATLGAFDVLGVSPTPLPSTWLMLLSGLVGLGFIAYRAESPRVRDRLIAVTPFCMWERVVAMSACGTKASSLHGGSMSAFGCIVNLSFRPRDVG